ncbi:MAG: hydrogen gas-evolving membrane-bound hydrogenase subunit E [Planctomycetota bacterium]|jgi:multisubunit Na+/H+ antiporter MnhB subunit
MGVELLIVILIAFMLVAAVIALEADDLLSSVIAVGAAGFALSVIDLLVAAPDLAITQVVVEVIMLVLLIRVVLKRRDTATTISGDLFRTGISLLACGVVLAVVFFAFGGLSDDGPTGVVPPFGEPVLANGEQAAVGPGVSEDYLAQTVEGTGAVNSVTAVLLDFRAYDTLGEATVIFVSVLGAYALLRQVGRRKEPLSP